MTELTPSVTAPRSALNGSRRKENGRDKGRARGTGGRTRLCAIGGGRIARDERGVRLPEGGVGGSVKLTDGERRGERAGEAGGVGSACVCAEAAGVTSAHVGARCGCDGSANKKASVLELETSSAVAPSICAAHAMNSAADSSPDTSLILPEADLPWIRIAS